MASNGSMTPSVTSVLGINHINTDAGNASPKSPPSHSSSSSSTSTSSSFQGSRFVSSLGLPPHIQRSLLVCIFYASVSVAISLLNKTLLSSYAFSCFFFMLAMQLTMTLAFCVLTRDYFGNPFRIPVFDMVVYKASIPMATAYIANVCLGLAGLQIVNVPMFSAIRRTSSAFVLLYEYLTIGRVADQSIRMSVGVIVLGTLVAGSGSLTADFMGYLLTACNNLATAAASVMQKQFSETAKLGGIYGMFGIMYYQAITALPACILLSMLNGEVGLLLNFPYLMNFGFWIGLVIASIMGLLLSYASLLSTTLNSPLATSITGNAKDVVLTIIGAVWFPGFVATVTSVGGLLLSFMGSGWFSYISLRKALMSSNSGGSSSNNTTVGSGSSSAVAASNKEENNIDNNNQTQNNNNHHHASGGVGSAGAGAFSPKSISSNSSISSSTSGSAQLTITINSAGSSSSSRSRVGEEENRVVSGSSSSAGGGNDSDAAAASTSSSLETDKLLSDPHGARKR